MNEAHNIWNTLARVLGVMLVMAAIMAVVIWYAPVVQENQRMREDKFALDQKIEQEQKVARKLDIQLHSFEDPTLERTIVERLARERLSYARPGENVVHFETPSTSIVR